MSEIEDKARQYLKENKKAFLLKYFDNKEIHKNKIAVFTAGTSGAGKTEYAIDRKFKKPFFIHIDIDDVRNFFHPIGYNGSNADDFQKPSAKGVNWLFDEASKKGYSLIMDSNFAEITIVTSNIKRLLKKDYTIEINYIYRDLDECIHFAKKREEITKRRVPTEIIKERLKSSFNTTLLIKKNFRNGVILNLFDMKNDKKYEDIDENNFLEILKEEII